MERLETIKSETLIEADPATIFAYLTDAERLTRWLGASATLDPRPGGIYLAEVGSGNVSRGEFKEVVPVSRLAYTWGWEKGPDLAPGASLIEIDLVPKNGTTLLRLTHSGVPAELAPSHRLGWAHYLARLALAASGRDPGPDQGPPSPGTNHGGPPKRPPRAQVRAKAKPARASKKTPARKAGAKKGTARNATSKKPAARKVAIRKTAAKKTTAKKRVARRPAGRRR